MNTSKKEFNSMCVKCDNRICYPLMKADDPLPPVENAPPYCPMRRQPDTIKKPMPNITGRKSGNLPDWLPSRKPNATS